LLDENGGPSGAVAAFIDITARVHAEEALQESERRYRTLFESMAEGFSLQEVIFDEQGQAVDYRILEVNPAYEQLIGRSRAELIGKTLRELAPSSPWIELFGEAVRTGKANRHEDFSLLAGKYVEMLINPMGGNIIASLTIDVTERRRSQEALRQSEARLRRLVESGIIGIIYSDEYGHIPLANDAFLDIVGYSRTDFESGRINLSTLTPPEYHALDAASIEEAYSRGACTPYEKELLRKNGSRVPVLIGYAYFRESATPFISFIVDLTEQKIAEAAVKKYAEQLERSNRELEDFAFVASHDLQEPLRKIQAFGERLAARLKEQGPADEDTRDYLERMMNAAVRMRAMINDLLSLSRVTTRGRPFQRVVLADVIAEVISDLEVRIERSGGQVRVDLGDLPVIDADEIQLSQLFQNLIGNALKFHKNGVPPLVEVYSQCNREQETVTIYVEDHGIGFDPQYVERIFQPFQRLHGRGEYEGSGIGLAVVRKIVERHSGTINARSSPGEGATFAVTLPISQPLPENTAASRED
jgi:PAS domain S-box-containing protein